MPKNLLQDMVKGKRTPMNRVRRVPVLQKEVHAEKEELEEIFPKQPKIPVHTSNKKTKHKARYMLWFVAFISLIFCFFALSYLFLTVTVTVNPKIQDVTLSENLSASKAGGAGVLPFDLIVISGEDTATAQASSTKDVLEKAKGTVVIYNAFGYSPQRLDVDTRLEGSNGKIYKTLNRVVVPGMKGNTPGSVEVGVYGEKAGEEYNSGPLDFTIFGFKGTPKYAKFYARSKGDITGGFIGKAPYISDAEKATAINNLKISLKSKLFEKALDQIPSGIVLFKNAASLNVDDKNVEVTSSQDQTLSIKVKGTLYGLLFDENKLTKKIAQDTIQNYDDSDVYLPNMRDLAFTLTSQDGTSFADMKNISFSLTGASKIVWKLDENKLVNDLLGKAKKDFNQVLLSYPNVDSADLEVSPFWKMSLPDKTKDIKIIVNYPK